MPKLSDAQLSKIQRFLNDEAMFDVVFNVIRESFLKPSKDRSVENLASRFVAIELLGEAKSYLARYVDEASEETKEVKQIGL